MISPVSCLMLLLKFCSMFVVSILVLTVNWTTIENQTPQNMKAGARKETRETGGSVLKGTNIEKGDIGKGGGRLSFHEKGDIVETGGCVLLKVTEKGDIVEGSVLRGKTCGGVLLRVTEKGDIGQTGENVVNVAEKRDIVKAGTKRKLETPHVIPHKLVRLNQGLTQDDLISVRYGHLSSCKASKEISVNTFYGKQKFNSTCTTTFSPKDRNRGLYSRGAVVRDSMRMASLQTHHLDFPIPQTKVTTKLEIKSIKENKDFNTAESMDTKMNLLVKRSFLLCSCDNFCSNTKKLNSHKNKILLLKRSNQYDQIKTKRYAQKPEKNESSQEVPNELVGPKKQVEKTVGGFSVNKFYGNRKRDRATTLEFITETKAFKYGDLGKPTPIDKMKIKDFAIPKINILDQGNKDVYEAEIDEIKIEAIVQHAFLSCSCRNCYSTCLKLNSQLTHKKKRKKNHKSSKKRRSTKYWKDLFNNKFKK